MGRLAVSELTTFRWSFEEDVAQYQAAGVPALGVWRQKLADLGDEQGREFYASRASSLPACSGPAASPAATATRTRKAWPTRGTPLSRLRRSALAA